MIRLRAGLRRVSGLKCIHTLPELALNREKGIPGLLSAKGLDVAWFQYQQYLLDRINEKTTQDESYSEKKTPFELLTAILQTGSAEDKPLAALASQAYANEVFFRSLRPASVNPGAKFRPEASREIEVSNEVRNPPPVGDIPGQPTAHTSIGAKLEYSFESIAAFRELMINQGASIFANGYVWLLEVNADCFLVNTYGWGNPYTSAQASSTSDDKAVTKFRPLMCLNLWEHVYLHDYGVGGKRQFAQNFFDAIDWGMVSSRAQGSDFGFH